MVSVKFKDGNNVVEFSIGTTILTTNLYENGCI